MDKIAILAQVLKEQYIIQVALKFTLKFSSVSLERSIQILCCRGLPILKRICVFIREHCIFYCLDDKHRIKIGEPDVTVAAAECGYRVFTVPGSEFLAADHDFTKLNFIPSVFFNVDIPDDISGSWYCSLEKIHHWIFSCEICSWQNIFVPWSLQ